MQFQEVVFWKSEDGDWAWRQQGVVLAMAVLDSRQ